MNKYKATSKSEIHNIWVYHWVYYSDTGTYKRKHTDKHWDWHPTGWARCLHYNFYLLLPTPQLILTRTPTSSSKLRPPPPTFASNLRLRPPPPTSATNLRYWPPKTSATDLHRPPLPTSTGLHRPPPTSATDLRCRPPLPTSTDLSCQSPLPTSATDLHRGPVLISADLQRCTNIWFRCECTIILFS